MTLRFPSVFVSGAVALVVAGCGFHPLYATDSSGLEPSHTFAAIAVEPIPERVGYELRNYLLDLFDSQNGVPNAQYRLKLTLREVREPFAFKGDESITRYNYTLYARYELTAIADNAVVKSGLVRTVAAYNVAQSPYTTVAAEKDAQDRAARGVAERVRTELAVYFRNLEPTPASAAQLRQTGSPAGIPQ